MEKMLVSALFLHQGKAVSSLSNSSAYATGDSVELAQLYSDRGADLLLVFDQSDTDEEHDASLTLMRRMARVADAPMWGAGNIRRVEDVKKILYAGCRKAVLNASLESNLALLEEVSSRFGREKIAVCYAPGRDPELTDSQKDLILQNADSLVLLADRLPEEEILPMPTVVWCESFDPGREELLLAVRSETICGIGSPKTQDPETDLMEIKEELKGLGAQVNTYVSTLSWEEVKKDANGLVPVVVQDYRNEEVLMVAWMNREAFEQTIRTGRMTYWSRSRQELWVKGLTSGHFQYLKELRVDCDNDTLLARVSQIGAACHTGNRSCFYRSVLKKDTPQRNPLKVFEDVYAVIEDRREHPKEGSYTNYLFDKGIDKILKKCGEEATEIVIAAKNPNPEEIKYEVADFLYHLMVLMSARQITWDDIAQELANRE